MISSFPVSPCAGVLEFLFFEALLAILNSLLRLLNPGCASTCSYKIRNHTPMSINDYFHVQYTMLHHSIIPFVTLHCQHSSSDSHTKINYDFWTNKIWNSLTSLILHSHSVSYPQMGENKRCNLNVHNTIYNWSPSHLTLCPLLLHYNWYVTYVGTVLSKQMSAYMFTNRKNFWSPMLAPCAYGTNFHIIGKKMSRTSYSKQPYTRTGKNNVSITLKPLFYRNVHFTNILDQHLLYCDIQNLLYSFIASRRASSCLGTLQRTLHPELDIC